MLRYATWIKTEIHVTAYDATRRYFRPAAVVKVTTMLPSEVVAGNALCNSLMKREEGRKAPLLSSGQ